MQTIKITISSKDPANVEISERKPEPDVKAKLAELFRPMLPEDERLNCEEGAEDEESQANRAKEESVSMEMVRAKLAALVQSDKQAQVKGLIEKYGGSKLSDIPPESYPALLQEAGEL